MWDLSLFEDRSPVQERQERFAEFNRVQEKLEAEFDAMVNRRGGPALAQMGNMSADAMDSMLAGGGVFPRLARA